MYDIQIASGNYNAVSKDLIISIYSTVSQLSTDFSDLNINSATISALSSLLGPCCIHSLYINNNKPSQLATESFTYSNITFNYLNIDTADQIFNPTNTMLIHVNNETFITHSNINSVTLTINLNSYSSIQNIHFRCNSLYQSEGTGDTHVNFMNNTWCWIPMGERSILDNEYSLKKIVEAMERWKMTTNLYNDGSSWSQGILNHICGLTFNHTGIPYYEGIIRKPVGQFSTKFYLSSSWGSKRQRLRSQIIKNLTYDSYTDNNHWLNKLLLIASDDAPQGSIGDDTQNDWLHLQKLGESLYFHKNMNFNEYYEGNSTDPGQPSQYAAAPDLAGSPYTSQILSELTKGVSMVLYTGHGNKTLVTTGYITSNDLKSLENIDKYIGLYHIVGCQVGELTPIQSELTFCDAACGTFINNPSSQNYGKPNGAVACFCSSVNQDWAPAMEGQDGFIDQLINNPQECTFGDLFKRTCNDMCTKYSMRQTDSGRGFRDLAAWLLIGDPSLRIRTRNPVLCSLQSTIEGIRAYNIIGNPMIACLSEPNTDGFIIPLRIENLESGSNLSSEMISSISTASNNAKILLTGYDMTTQEYSINSGNIVISTSFAEAVPNNYSILADYVVENIINFPRIISYTPSTSSATKLAIFVDPEFLEDIVPLVEWKRRSGIMVNVYELLEWNNVTNHDNIFNRPLPIYIRNRTTNINNIIDTMRINNCDYTLLVGAPEPSSISNQYNLTNLYGTFDPKYFTHLFETTVSDNI